MKLGGKGRLPSGQGAKPAGSTVRSHSTRDMAAKNFIDLRENHKIVVEKIVCNCEHFSKNPAGIGGVSASRPGKVEIKN
jgi:hypothetical protein